MSPSNPRAHVRAWLALLRPANSLTAAADVLAGYVVAMAIVAAAVGPGVQGLLLALAGISLYAGGIALNDVVDAGVDAGERPERPIPRGLIDRRLAGAIASMLLVLGVGFAALADRMAAASSASAVMATIVVAFILLYNGGAKYDPWFGPVAMAGCRGFNLLIGLAAATGALTQFWWVALIPALHVFFVTRVSRAETAGGERKPAMLLLAAVAALSLGLLVLGGVHPVWMGVVVYAVLALPPSIRACRDPEPELVQAAVKFGVLSLVPLDAAIALLYGEWWMGISILALLPISIALGRTFSVT